MIRHAVTRPVSTLTAVGALVALGLFSLFQLPVSLLPRLERPTIRVTIEAPTWSRENLLERVVEPMEPRLLSVKGATSVRSLVRDGRAVLFLESDWFVDSDRFHIEVERRLADLRRDADVETTVELRPADRFPVAEVAVTGGDSAGARTAFVRDLLQPEISSLQGVSQVEAVGLTPRRVVVRPWAAELAARGMTAADLEQRLRLVGVPFPTGEARRGARVSPLVIEEDVHSLRELRRLPIGRRNGARLGDVAEVGVETVTTGQFARVDGQSAVLVRVFRAPGANGIALVNRVRKLVDTLDHQHREAHVAVVRDRSAEIVYALGLLGLAALIGLVTGALILRLTLGSWRHALTLAAIVPGAGLASFTAFYFFHISLNLISLSGLGLAIGLLVDSAIVVLEAIENARATGEEEPAVQGTRKVAGAVVAAFLTTAVVFLPLIYLTGLARAFFGIQAFVIVTSLLFALLLSLTLTPVLNRRAKTGTPRAATGLTSYRSMVANAIEHPRVVFLLATLLVGGGALLLPQLPRELMPTGRSREVQVQYYLPGTLGPVHRSDLGERLVHRVSGMVARFHPESVIASQAAAAPLSAPDDPDGEIVMRFGEAAVARRALAKLQHSDLGVPGVLAQATLHPTALLEAAQRAGGRYEILVTAGTPTESRTTARRLLERLRQTNGLQIAPDSMLEEQPLLRFDLTAAGDGAIDPATLRNQVSAGLGEKSAGRATIPGVEPEILLRPTQAPRLEALPVKGSSGKDVVPLGTWASLREDRQPKVVERQDGHWASRIAVLRPDPAGMAKLQQLVNGTSWGVGTSVHLGGEAWELQRSFRQLTFLLVLSLLLVLFTVTALYESLTVSLVIMATIPLGLAGAVGLLFASGQTLNVMSFLGLVLLAGIVVNNSIVLIHRAEQLRKAGDDLRQAVMLAATERYRPILITTLTTLAGMIPLAMLGGEGVELRRALSLAVVGGLVTSTAASLLLVPTLYYVVHRQRGAASQADG